MELAGLIAAYANASPRVRYQLQQVSRIVQDFQDRDPDEDREFRPVGVKDLTKPPVESAKRLIRDRLTPGQIEQLIASCRAGGTITEAARTYGISPSSVSRLLRKSAGLDNTAPGKATPLAAFTLVPEHGMSAVPALGVHQYRFSQPPSDRGQELAEQVQAHGVPE